jgi:hypothetical protein
MIVKAIMVDQEPGESIRDLVRAAVIKARLDRVPVEVWAERRYLGRVTIDMTEDGAMHELVHVGATFAHDPSRD